MPSTRILILAASALLAVPASAVAADAAKVRVDEKPFLVETSNGAYVTYSLSGAAAPARQTVTIDGKKAKVRVDDKAAHDYRALVTRPSLEQGRTYKVTLRIKRAGAADLVRSERLVLHRGGASPEHP